MSIELGLKALVLMGGVRPRKSHDPAELRTSMTPERWELAQSIPRDLLRGVKGWREAAHYEDVLDELNLTNTELCELAERYVDAAVDFAALVIREFERTYPEYGDPDRVVARLARRVQRVQENRSLRDLWDGTAASTG
ncbi:hypothetical protein [Candidatus Poriferisodalis sp.]|uniref:hypothetical protein n=1 Tax=Candidatus Poriferisodalis sp. TaxID=3101277 RepID=UPI003B0216A1